MTGLVLSVNVCAADSRFIAIPLDSPQMSIESKTETTCLPQVASAGKNRG